MSVSRRRINTGFTLDPGKVAPDRKLPNVVVVAANAKGEIVRYFESGETAPYFGSPMARDGTTGRYVRGRDGRHIASTGKILAAIGIANEHRDTAASLYQDQNAPRGNTDTCERGDGTVAGPRKALVSFACSHNKPLEWRTAQLGQSRVAALVEGFGFNLPPADQAGEGVPPSTAVVRGLIGGSPRRVHHMASVVLAALIDKGGTPVRAPSLVKAFDYISKDDALAADAGEAAILPNKLIKPHGRALLKTLLSAPLCYRHGGQAHGTLKSLAAWCADGRADMRLHFAKTGTSTTTDADATVDTWTAGGVQFANGAAYSYVVMVGTGSARETWARKLHAAQATAPLVSALLDDLKVHGQKHPAPGLLPPAPQPVAEAPPRSPPSAGVVAKGLKPASAIVDWKARALEAQ